MYLCQKCLWGGVVGVGLGLLHIAYFYYFSPASAIQHLTVVLVGAGAVYIGFGLADGNLESVIVESIVAVGFWVIAVMGALFSPLLLACGFFAHAVWDLCHDSKIVKTKVKLWYPPFCAVYDCIVGMFLILPK